MNTEQTTALDVLEGKFGVIEQPVVGVSIAYSPDLVSMVKGFRMSLDFFKKSPPDKEDLKQLECSFQAIEREYYGNQSDSEYEAFG